ncbi:hypothetical protein [Hymenobacter lapidiphilus]|uniref:Uncharacterized protein n=1 Tax=Hymenobacter lapidiphilus TaxID=2608003 RepID=A0A7Y7PN25_9BACT|nr:hypothetical protein [Hymenobacter lapidiphilus]NVO30866.1 hypothetical protein [Hymenobacter lapidiphilus]
MQAQPQADAVPAWNCAGCRLCSLTPQRQLCQLRHLLRWHEARLNAAALHHLPASDPIPPISLTDPSHDI